MPIKYITYAKRKNIKDTEYVQHNTLFIKMRWLSVYTCREITLIDQAYGTLLINISLHKYKIILVDYTKEQRRYSDVSCILRLIYKNKSYISTEYQLSKSAMLELFGVKL